MPGLQTIGSTRAVGLVGTDQAMRVTNTNASGTLFIGPQATLTASVFTTSIAAGGSAVISGPNAAIGSTDILCLVNEIAVQPRVDNVESRYSNFYHLGGTVAGQAATSTTPVAGTAFISEMFIPQRCITTGGAYLVGGVGGTDLAWVALWDVTGNLLATSALAGTTAGTTATFQELPWVTPYEILVPGKYHIGVGMNGTTARISTAPVVGPVKSKTQASVFSAGVNPTAITIPTTSATNTAPIAYVF